MTVQFETPTPTEGILTIALEQTDVQPRVDKKLREVAQRVSIKGFRPGKVPAQLVKKMYGEEVLVQEMNDLLGDTINTYFMEHKEVFMLGNPMPMETGAPVDLKRPETYKFAFRCGIVPPFEYNLEQVYVKDYEVIIDEPTIDKAIHQLQHEHGKFGPADFISSEDIVKGALYDTMHDYSVEENRPENGLAVGETAEETRFYLETYLPMNQVSEAIKQHFLNASVGTIIHFDINELMNDSEKGLTLLTGKTKEEMDKLEGDFAFEVKEILHNSHAELNEELFKKVFPAKEIASTEDFRAAIKEDTAKYYEARNKELKKHQVQKQLIENTQIDLPHDFLKEFFAQRGKNTTEKIEEDYPKIEKSVRWEVISLKMNEKYQFQVSDEEIHNEAVNALMNMYGQYGQSAEIYQYISQMAGDYAKKNFNTLAQSVLTDKILDVVAQDLSSAKQLVSEDEFWEIYRAQN